MVDKFPITPEGYEKLTAELTNLKAVERPAIIAAIAEARAHGDLSENAEYASAREKQSMIEAKIANLEEKLSRAEIIDIKTLSGDRVVFGATVTLVDEDAEDEESGKVTYKIVSDLEIDISKGHISPAAPVAQAMMGKALNETIEARTPSGIKYYKIVKIEFL